MARRVLGPVSTGGEWDPLSRRVREEEQFGSGALCSSGRS